MIDFFLNLDSNTRIRLIAILAALMIYLTPKIINRIRYFVSWIKWKKGNHFVRKVNKKRKKKKIVYVNMAERKNLKFKHR